MISDNQKASQKHLDPEFYIEPRKEKWYIFLGFLAASILEGWVLLTHDIKFEKWSDWLIVLGAVTFPIMTLLGWLSIRNNWSVAESNRSLVKTICGVLISPLLLAIIVLSLWALASGFGWLTTIPSWAAIIIGLLVFVIILLYKRR